MRLLLFIVLMLPLSSSSQTDTLNAENEFWGNGNMKSQKIHTGYHYYDYTSWHRNGQIHVKGAHSYSNFLRIDNSWDSLGNPMVVDGMGKQVYYYNNNVKEKEGRISEGFPSGIWVEYFETGAKKAEGNYERGLKDGTWTFWNEEGEKIEEKKCTKNFCHYWNTWDEDRKQLIIEGNGFITLHYSNGNKKGEGEIKGGKKFGFWTEWYENGQVRATFRFKESPNSYFNPPREFIDSWDSLGIQIGKNGTGLFLSYNEADQLIGKAYLKNSVWDSLDIDYYENGLPEIVDLYENGQWRHRTIYHNNGNKQYEVSWGESGLRIPHGRVRRWYYNGQLESEKYYDQGKILKSTTYYSNGQKSGERSNCVQTEIEESEVDGVSTGGMYLECDELYWDINGNPIEGR